MMAYYPCDELDHCPYDATEGIHCYNHCGLGADEDEEFYEDLHLEQQEQM